MRPEPIASSLGRWLTLARTDFRAAAARRLSEERELSPAIISLLSNDRQGRSTGGGPIVDVDRITPNPEQPRLAMDATQLHEPAASIREHGGLPPIPVRPLANNEVHPIPAQRPLPGAQAARPPPI